MSHISRRRFLKLAALSAVTVPALDATLVEPRRLRVKQLSYGSDKGCRFVQFSDLHYRGNSDYAAEVVSAINELKPEFVCFTGDLIEHKEYLGEALSFIRQIGTPVYGAPGNHDYWSTADFTEYARAFRATGGDWLVDRSLVLPQHDLELHGMGRVGIHAFKAPQAGRRVILCHYPGMADTLGQKFDLILAGHSHGGQIRLPLYGPMIIPMGVGNYDLGRFETPCGSLYVNAGVGTLSTIPFRWNCPPEITVISL